MINRAAIHFPKSIKKKKGAEVCGIETGKNYKSTKTAVVVLK